MSPRQLLSHGLGTAFPRSIVLHRSSSFLDMEPAISSLDKKQTKPSEKTIDDVFRPQDLE